MSVPLYPVLLSPMLIAEHPISAHLAQKSSDKMIPAVCSQTSVFHVPYHCNAYRCKDLTLLLEGPGERQS